MSYTYQEIFDRCVESISKGRQHDPRHCSCESRILERGCHIDALLGEERAKMHPGVPLCTGCLVAPQVGVKEHPPGSQLAVALVEAGVPATPVSCDLLDHFNFIHDLSGDDWQECVEDCAKNIRERHRLDLCLDCLKRGTVH